MIKITSLNKYYNKNKSNENHVIKNLNLELPSKGLVGIFGKSGCGKTTLLNLIGSLDKQTSGTIKIDNITLNKNNDNLRNKYIGYIFQNYNLNNKKTCFENIEESLLLCGVKDKTEINTKVNSALHNVGMDNYGKRYPQTLSGGQMQRISIARAIVKNPEIILADEPTGNLDEHNTLIIINLLKQLSKDRLVLLVTHEQNLVDNYCDKVIEIVDGEINKFYDNTTDYNINYNNSNVIYLDQLEKQEFSNNNINLEYYGNNPVSPIDIQIINNNGSLYINLLGQKIQILNNKSEIKILKNKPETLNTSNSEFNFENIDNINYSKKQKLGKIYNFSNTIKECFRTLFLKKKHKKTFLKILLCLFTIAIAITTSLFASNIKSATELKDTVNKNVLYMYIPSTDVSNDIYDISQDESSCISSIYFQKEIPTNRNTLGIISGYFETVDTNNLSTYYEIQPQSSITSNSLIIGNLATNDEEILISKGCADYILENSNYSFISSYNDLLNLITDSYTFGSSLKIVGITNIKEPEVYLSDKVFKETTSINNARYKLDTSVGLRVNDNECYYIYLEDEIEEDSIPKLNNNILIDGKQFKVSQIIKIPSSYENYLSNNNITDLDLDSYITQKAEDEFNNTVGKSYKDILDTNYYKYMNDYYSYYDDYISLYTRYLDDYESDEFSYLFLKQLDNTYYNYVMTFDLGYYESMKYFNANNTFPTKSYIDDLIEDKDIETFETDILNIIDEIIKTKNEVSGFYYYVAINENEIDSISHRVGNTDSSILYYYYDYITNSYNSRTIKLIWFEDYNEDVFSDNNIYAVIYSSNIEQTYEKLSSYAELNNINNPYFDSTIFTYKDLIESLKLIDQSSLITNIVIISIMIIVVCICIYFIMRSDMLENIKEIGIYRAIGLSKKNIIFKYFIEITCLFIITILITFIITSIIISSWIKKSYILSTMLFYPIYISIPLLIAIYGIFVLFGLLPIFNLLRKKPSEILSQYDI